MLVIVCPCHNAHRHATLCCLNPLLLSPPPLNLMPAPLRFLLPCILGFVEQLPKLNFRQAGSGQAVSSTLTLIARRSADRAGTRQWRRGADSEGGWGWIG
jgi:hypothetical protein